MLRQIGGDLRKGGHHDDDEDHDEEEGKGSLEDIAEQAILAPTFHVVALTSL